MTSVWRSVWDWRWCRLRCSRFQPPRRCTRRPPRRLRPRSRGRPSSAAGAGLPSRPGQRSRPELQRTRRDRGQVGRRGLDDRVESRRALSAAERQQAVGVDHRARRGRQGPREARRPGQPDPRRHHPVPPAHRRADPAERRLHHEPWRPHVQGDHHQRQYRQRQADALGRRAERGARDDRPQGPRRDPLLQRRARAPEQDRRA